MFGFLFHWQADEPALHADSALLLRDCILPFVARMLSLLRVAIRGPPQAAWEQLYCAVQLCEHCLGVFPEDEALRFLGADLQFAAHGTREEEEVWGCRKEAVGGRGQNPGEALLLWARQQNNLALHLVCQGQVEDALSLLRGAEKRTGGGGIFSL